MINSFRYYLLIVLLYLFSCKIYEKNNDVINISELNYQPQMVGPNIISTSLFEGHASITPDSSQIYYAIYSNDHSYSTIVYSEYLNNEWKEPQIVSFSGKYSDGSPALSPNGQVIFFSSRRPTNNTSNLNLSNDLWYVERSGEEWGQPIRLPNGINTPYNEFSPSVDKNGNLYFCSNRPGGFGDMDVYFSEFSEGAYKEPILLDSAINTPFHEGNVGVSPDGNLLLLMVQHKPGDLGYDDIHYSIKKNDTWSQAKNIGPIINTYSYDFSPKISPNGQILYFSSRVNRNYNLTNDRYTYKSFLNYLNSPLNGLGNIYRIEINKLNLTNE